MKAPSAFPIRQVGKVRDAPCRLDQRASVCGRPLGCAMDEFRPRCVLIVLLPALLLPLGGCRPW